MNHPSERLHIGARSAIWLSSLRGDHATDPMTTQGCISWKNDGEELSIEFHEKLDRETIMRTNAISFIASDQCNLLCANPIFHLMDDCVVDCFVRSWRRMNGSMSTIIDQADVCCVRLYLLLPHYSISLRIVLDTSALVTLFQHLWIHQLSFDDNPLLLCFFRCEEKLQRVYVMMTCNYSKSSVMDKSWCGVLSSAFLTSLCTGYLLIVEFFLLHQQMSHFVCSIRRAWVPDYGDQAKSQLEWTEVGNDYSLEYLLFSS